MSLTWEAVIGLEVHCQLLVPQKLFCGCPTTFGGVPNARTCPVCLGLPGALPVLSREAVACALRVGAALECVTRATSIFARKHYFYPDLPKGYQITQYEAPLLEFGGLDIDTATGVRRIGIRRIHMEEDAGKSIHTDAGTLVDLNRAGVPLVEIVSDPDLRSADEAVAYLKALHEIVRFIGVCDGNMEEGSFRCDANVSIRPAGSPVLGTRTELKNLNTFKGVHRAIEYEIARHAHVLEEGGAVVQETRLWDDAAGRTRAMRGKEDAHDYRYFPEPDLPPLRVDADEIAAARASLPPLPAEIRRRYVEELGLTAYDAGVLTSEPALVRWYETALTHHRNAKGLCNWLTTELLGRVAVGELETCPVTPAGLAELVALIDDGTISGKIAKTVFDGMFESGESPGTLVETRGLRQVTDTAAIEAAVREVLEANPTQLAQFRAGKVTVRGFFVGQIMRRTGGTLNPARVNEVLDRLLAPTDNRPDES
ncbi:Asp-tRNA(Asn)/Glu-tRNA(Gln) amidotransferase subunit GatB [Myxococcota bacterium]|nr:Asp-tRNA(Asn)/Glu-tRNA(Gln) amidotransferase subunit GatB [Myxococcota bacterium]